MAGVPEPIKHHPNASTATGLGGVGVLVVWLLGRNGVSLSGEDSAVISGAVTSVGLLIGKRGVRGLFSVFWKGD